MIFFFLYTSATQFDHIYTIRLWCHHNIKEAQPFFQAWTCHTSRTWSGNRQLFYFASCWQRFQVQKTHMKETEEETRTTKLTFHNPNHLMVTRRYMHIRTYWSFATPRIHCARWVKYGSAWALLLNIGPRLCNSILNSFSKLLQYKAQRTEMRKRNGQTKESNYLSLFNLQDRISNCTVFSH